MKPDGVPPDADSGELRPAADADVVVRTFLIADVRGYTRFTQAHGDEEAGNLAASFAALTRDAVTELGGELIELRGDEALCAFHSARQALRAAVELQVRFRHGEASRPAFPLGIGVGLAAGEAVPIEGGYRGGALNLAARLCSIAGPGQILASETVTSLAGRFEGARFVERRATRLKGMEKPVRPIEVVPDVELPPLPSEAAGRRRRLHVVAVVGAVLAAALAAALFALVRGSDEPERVGNAIAAIDGDGSVSYIEAGTTPSTIAVGGGAVWVLNADDRTISRLDPETKEIRTVGIEGIPTELAVGEGAVWVGLGTESRETLGDIFTSRVVRLDPLSTARAGEPEELPGGRVNLAGPLAAGASRLAAGAGAVWAVNPGGSVSRLNPATGDFVELIPLQEVSTLAAGPEGVWALAGGNEVVEIDPATNRPKRPVSLPVEELWGLAVGAGSVWATDLVTGVLWRIDPDREGVPRPIDVGFGVTAVAYGAGFVWVTNFVTDEVLRVDPQTNRVAARIRIAGTPPSVAADEDGAWVSVAGAPRGDTLPTSVCGPVESRGGRPDVLIASDLPLQGPGASFMRTVVDAIRLVLRRENFRAGPHTVGFQSCDDSTARAGGFNFLKCASNAKAYAATERVVGVIGPFQSPCAWAQIPIANRAEGPLAMISPSNTHTGLTHKVPGSGDEEPGVYYPTGVRNYFRVTGAADVDGAAGAVLADELGLRRVFVLRSTDASEEFTAPFTREARRLGIEIAGSAQWRSDGRSYDGLAARVAAARPDGVFIGDGLYANGGEVVKALRARLGQDVVLIAGDAFQPPSALLEAAGRAAIGMYTTTTAVAHEGLGAAGKRFARDFRREHGVPLPSALYAIETAAATEALLAAIERSDGTRASVIEELRTLDLNGILGPIRFDRNGDVVPAAFTVLKITGGTRRDPALPKDATGAVVDRVVRVPAGLTQP